MNDTTEAECFRWYSVEYWSPSGAWGNANISDGGKPVRFSANLDAARERLTFGKFPETKKRRLLKHTLQDGIIHTEIAEIWDNPAYRQPE